MPEAAEVQGLSGNEIINDVLLQVKRALERDCNLRDTDNYGRGYSGKIKLNLQMFALDTATVDMEVTLQPTQEFLKTHEATPQDATGSDVQIEQEIEIPLQSNLNAVREAAEAAQQTGQRPEPIPEEEARMPVHRRNYGKPPTMGGAEDVT
jgi:hypothetical protein